MTTSRPRLLDLIAALHRAYGDPFLPPVTDPFGLILWEQVAYLANDARRSKAFTRLANEVGLTPAAVTRADPSLLTAVAKAGGGTATTERADRMRTSAELVARDWGGDLGTALTGSHAAARKVLTAFPMIGPPGADKILVLSGIRPVLALDSNGVRALLRLGYGTEETDYGHTYASVQTAASGEYPEDCAWLARAYGLLRTHGQRICRRGTPKCSQCAVEAHCPASGARRDP